MEDHKNLEFDFTETRLAGKVILVAGGTGGLGSATVALLMKEAAIPVVGYRGDHARARHLKEVMEARYNGPLHLVEGDISQQEVRTKYIRVASNVGEEIYGFVSFVGDPARVNFNEIKDQDMETSLRTNYIAPVLLAKMAADHMVEKGTEGGIVLMSSMQAVGLFENSLNYAGPKAALIHAVKIYAKRWRGKNIRVNVVAPGVTQAGMAESSVRQGKYDAYVKNGVIKRFGRAEDVARAVRLLLEPDNYITGQVITVDGGLTL